MAEGADDAVVKYRRRLDRTPEKQFEKFPDGVKKLVCSMRGALENCKNKVEELKNNNDEKEKTIEDERSRRKEAEKRLRQLLVDPYASPEVNSELRHRLPRANQADPLLDIDVAAESSGQSEAEGEAVRQSRALRNNAESSFSPKRMKGSKNEARRVLNFQPPSKSPRSSRSNLNDKAELEDSECESEEDNVDHQREPRSRHRRGKIKSPSSYSPEHSAYPPLHYPHYAPGVPVVPVNPLGHYISPMHAPFTLTPWSSVSSMGMAPTSYSRGEREETVPRTGIPLSRSYPLLNGDQVDMPEAGAHLPEEFPVKVQPSDNTGSVIGSALQPDSTLPQSSGPADAAGHATASGSHPQNSAAQLSAIPSCQNPTAQKPAIVPELMSQSASSMESSHYALPTALPRESVAQTAGVGERFRLPVPQTVPAYSVPLLGAGGRSRLADASVQQTSLLQDEIGRLKETNHQLKERLALCTKEVEVLKLQMLTETPKDGTVDSEAAQKFAELMSEVRAAEKRRQETLEARVIQAEQDKEQLIQDFEDSLLRTGVEKRSGRRLRMKDLSSASETEDSDEEEEEEEEEKKVIKAEHSSPSLARRSSDAGRIASLKDALKEVEHRQRREVEIYQEEIQVVMEQRDQALEQLQAERQKTQLQQLQMPSQREQMLMAKISVLQREKDRAENSARQLREEQVERNLYISLHKALFPDSALNDCQQTSPADGKVKMKAADEDDNNDKGPVTMKEDNQLLEQLRQANQEKTFLQRRCEELEAVCKQEKEDKNRLERLNGVLRRKLIAVSTADSQTSQDT